jgi:hypothetical protein
MLLSSVCSLSENVLWNWNSDASPHITVPVTRLRPGSPPFGGSFGADEFPIRSTRRQFRRYLESWKRDEWATLADAALGALSDEE